MVLSKKCAKFDYGYFQNLVRYYQVQELFFALSVQIFLQKMWTPRLS